MAGHPHPLIRSIGQINRARDAREESSVISTANSYVEPFLLSPALRRNTATSDFALDELLDGDPQGGRAVSLYLATKADVADAMAPVMRLFLACLIKRIQCRDLGQRPRHRLSLLCDEFSSMGYCSAIAEGTPRLREYHVTLVFGVQSLNDFVRCYGPHNSLLNNCPTKVVYAIGEGDAEIVSKWLGPTTVATMVTSRNWGRGTGGWSAGTSRGPQYNSRPLRFLDELTSQDTERMLVLRTGRRPVRGWRIHSWDHAVFQARQTVSAVENEPIPSAANDNPFAPVPIPQRAKVAAVAAMLLLPLGGWSGYAVFQRAAPSIPLPLPSPAAAADDLHEACEASAAAGLVPPKICQEK